MNFNDEEEINQFNEDQKKRRKFTKDDAIYGVFNDDWEDDDVKMSEEDYWKMKKRFSTPIGFVASGVYEPNENKVTKDNDNNDDTNSKEKEKKKKEKKEKKQKKDKKNKRGGIGSKNDEEEDIPIEDKPVGGIGAALLSKWGYKGTGGLGANGTGMVEPIKVVVRPKNAGLSSVKEANNNNDSSSSEDESDSSEDEENKRSLGWKKKKDKLKSYDFNDHLDNNNITKKTTTTTTTTSTSTPQIVIDMRGPEARLYTSIDQVKNKHNHHHHQDNSNIHTHSNQPLGELKHNVDLLLKLKYIDLQNQSTKIKHEKDKISNLTRGVDKLKLTIENDDKQIDKVNEILSIIKSTTNQFQLGELTLKSLYKTFKQLKTQFPKEYQSFKLFNLEKELLQPLLKTKLQDWNIIEDPSFLSKEMIKWRQLFDDGSSSSSSSNGNNTVYFLIIRDLILPKFKQFLRNQWDVKRPSEAALLIANWTDSLPEVIQETLLEQYILPKLKIGIERWDPKTDTVAIDYWLLPWIPFLHVELEMFFPNIRQKIIGALNEWHPSDTSAISILKPWKDIFEGNTLTALINRSILPKLSKLIQQLKIDPSNQSEPHQINWLLEWNKHDLIPLPTLISIFEKDFFTRWLSILLDWLKSPKSDFAEISNWYAGWKKQFPPSVISDDKIKQIFNIALNLMKKVISDQKIDSNDDNLVNQKINSILNGSSDTNNNNNNSNQHQQQPIKSISDSPPLSSTSIFDNISTKQMIEQIAVNNGLLFIPTDRKSDTGQKIYIFDKIPIIIEKDLILIQVTGNSNKWEPANIQSLLNKSLNK